MGKEKRGVKAARSRHSSRWQLRRQVFSGVQARRLNNDVRQHSAVALFNHTGFDAADLAVDEIVG